jgi:peptidoglycan/LPS O-acetylase OafA/YrhL
MVAALEGASIPAAASAGVRPASARVPALDGVRGLAILAVLAGHFSAWLGYQSRFFQFGWLGVDLFFALSGYLITGILIDTAGSPGYFRSFYARRTLRIFPLYYAVLAAVFFGGPALGATANPEFRRLASEQLWLWLYASNVGNVFIKPFEFRAGWLELRHFWSLAVEEHFYLVWPAFLLYSGRRFSRACIMVILAVILCRLAMVVYGAWWGEVSTLTWCRADALAAGALMASVARERGSAAAARLGWLMLVSGLAILLALILSYGVDVRQGWPMEIVGYTASAVAFAGLVAVVAGAGSGGFAAIVWANPPLRILGKYSYGLYVYHGIFGEVIVGVLSPRLGLSRDFRSALIVIAAGLLVSFVVAWTSYHVPESPFLRLKRFFPSRRP